MGLQAAYSGNQLNPCANGSLCVVLVRLWVAKVDENYNRWRPISSCSPERVSRRLGKGA